MSPLEVQAILSDINNFDDICLLYIESVKATVEEILLFVSNNITIN